MPFRIIYLLFIALSLLVQYAYILLYGVCFMLRIYYMLMKTYSLRKILFYRGGLRSNDIMTTTSSKPGCATRMGGGGGAAQIGVGALQQYATLRQFAVRVSRRTALLVTSSLVSVYACYTYCVASSPHSSSHPHYTKTLHATAYKALPLNMMSRVAGLIAHTHIPRVLRHPLLGCYVSAFGCDMSEAQHEDLAHYECFSQFFRRSLKPECRPIAQHAPLTSPVDGTVLSMHELQLDNQSDDATVNRVKGVNYNVFEFFGMNPDDDVTHHQQHLRNPFTTQSQSGRQEGGRRRRLFNCVIYLSPGDYHRFHSPAGWRARVRRHFPGLLLSVRPAVMQWLPGLLALNERVVLLGDWPHGFFAYSAVGATNVGSIRVFADPQLATNRASPIAQSSTKHSSSSSSSSENSKKSVGIAQSSPPPPHFEEKQLIGGTAQYNKGELIGEFNLGSTIVLTFEAPADFEFCVQEGQHVRYGEPLGTFRDCATPSTK